MIKEKIQKFTFALRKGFITFFLFMLYIFGFGLTFILVYLFNRKLLRISKKGVKTFWKEAQGYDADINQCLRES